MSYLNEVSYPLNVSLIRMRLTSPGAGVGVGVPGPMRTRETGHGLHEIVQSNTPITIVYDLHSLYIEGFYNRDKTLFLTKHSKYSVSADVRLPYGNEYGELGLDRSEAITIGLGDVNGALTALHHASRQSRPDTLKRPLWVTCLAFAEAVRFDDVLLAILRKEPITDLDWTKHKKTHMIRVVKS